MSINGLSRLAVHPDTNGRLTPGVGGDRKIMDESSEELDEKRTIVVPVPPKTLRGYETPQVEKREKLAEITGYPSGSPRY